MGMGGLSDPWPLGKAPAQQPRGRAPGRQQGRSPRAVGFPAALSSSKIPPQSPCCRPTVPGASGLHGTDHPTPGKGWGRCLAGHSPGTGQDRGSLPLELSPSCSSQGCVQEPRASLLQHSQQEPTPVPPPAPNPKPPAPNPLPHQPGKASAASSPLAVFPR